MEQITLTRNAPDAELEINVNGFNGRVRGAVLFVEEADCAGAHVIVPKEDPWNALELVQALGNLIQILLRQAGYEEDEQ